TAAQRPFTSALQGIQSTLNTVASIIAVSSCKGGVGKSTVAGYLAQELASRGFQVGLVDADIHGPSIPTLFNMTHAEVYINDKKQLIPVERNNLKIMSFGFLLGDGPAVMRGPMVSQYVQQVLHNTDWGKLDYLFIDMPPGTGDVQLTITQSVRLSGAVIVTTPQTLSLIDVTRGILMFEKVNVPILGVIENMSYFICDHCRKKHYIFGSSGSKSIEERFGIEILAELPLLAQLTYPMDSSVGNDFIRQALDRIMMALGKSTVQQKEVPQIQFDSRKVTLAWSDGTQIQVSNRDLRLSCRCAVCINEMTGERILQEKDVRSDIVPQEVIPLGNYAVGITWNDGHASGIYPYRAIKELAGISSTP
ncbi:MAG: hypothetical protein A3G91_01175, partial [Omnitrophica WOR_2 bacterium RIFCSPLOWO2_12_FULL_50_9]